jgi:DNA-3-methyladenine glycosylase I
MNYAIAMADSTDKIHRCVWAGSDPLYLAYHDTEWGVPLHDDRRLFEMLVLEGAQAGLSWITILRKREAYRRAFDAFDPRKVARYDARRIGSLLADPGIVRNRLKIESAVKNARAFLQVVEVAGSFDAYIWQFVGGRPMVNAWKAHQNIPARTEESDAMSRDLRKRGFSFVGSTICYAFMQATGMVNDHVVDCFRYQALRGAGAPGEKIAQPTRTSLKRAATLRRSATKSA